jgi:glyoxylase-like metal-dependent hydrolase (beta-lactamase superfamily II)
MPLAVDRYGLGPAQTNCYLVRRDARAAQAAVIDPGADAAWLQSELARISATCAAILITHTHWDHLGAVADLAEASGAPVYMPRLEATVLARPDEFYPGMAIRPYEADVLLDGEETVEVADIAFETVGVPGHSPGHVGYYADGALFSGDVLFAGSVGRTDLPFSDWDTLVASIRSLMARFPPDTVVYPGHGPETTLGAELARNPFLAELRAS